VASIYSLIIVPSLPPPGPLLIVLVLGAEGASRVDSFIAHCPVVGIRDVKAAFWTRFPCFFVPFLGACLPSASPLSLPLSLGNWYSKVVSDFEIFVITSTMWISL
jgi:hypothetical protein